MYTYAFTDDTNICLPTGMVGELTIVEHNGISAIVEPGFSLQSCETDDRALLQAVMIHDCVLRVLFAQTTILPLRFGTEFASEQDLLQHLQESASHYFNKLTDLDGKAEYLLKLSPVDCPEEDLNPQLKGRAYFQAKKQLAERQYEWQQKQRTSFEMMLGMMATIGAKFVAGSGHQVHLLLDRANNLPQTVSDWQAHCPFWQVQVSEELPPYHFV
ncbi:GvpL/GvpF family gas vesicle protein [Alkalinema sp. FACHB-956]|uniref:GvpL/GvpF family gas vesicle protein n=1 Tax=Alkalinema sp. FACHB-956 TaxID=2692768 RepID=UPI001684216C|nr:GvpL/GvpF family gas vesicle protein [Alkalinema sp. FACHB-956]MBD2329408.1 GvpL/GvpF family gas vesicle protein [Alkalinema sp. FACHB-956]